MKTTRREFAVGAFAAAGVVLAEGCASFGVKDGDPVVGEAYPAWESGHFQIHMIYTGVAESQLIIFPDGTSILIDCGDQSFLIIKITNKCTSPSVTGATTKDDKVFHGIGLKSVKQIIDQYDGNFDLTFEDGLAVAKIMIQN